MSSEETASLNQDWPALVSAKAAITGFTEKLDVPQFPLLAFAKVQEGSSIEELDTYFGKARGKVSAFAILRSLVRPVPPEVTRSMLVTKAKAMVAKLEGHVSAKLDIIVTRMTGPIEA